MSSSRTRSGSSRSGSTGAGAYVRRRRRGPMLTGQPPRTPRRARPQPSRTARPLSRGQAGRKPAPMPADGIGRPSFTPRPEPPRPHRRPQPQSSTPPLTPSCTLNSVIARLGAVTRRPQPTTPRSSWSSPPDYAARSGDRRFGRLRPVRVQTATGARRRPGGYSSTAARGRPAGLQRRAAGPAARRRGWRARSRPPWQRRGSSPGRQGGRRRPRSASAGRPSGRRC